MSQKGALPDRPAPTKPTTHAADQRDQQIPLAAPITPVECDEFLFRSYRAVLATTESPDHRFPRAMSAYSTFSL